MFGFLKKLGYFVTHPTSSRTIGILAILVIATSVPLTVFIAQKQQELRQRAATTCTLKVYETSDCSGEPSSTAPVDYERVQENQRNQCASMGYSEPSSYVYYDCPLNPDPEVTLKADKTTVDSGKKVDLTWTHNVGISTSCAASSSPEIPNWNSTSPPSGTLKNNGTGHGVNPIETTTFTLKCEYSGGKTARSSVTINVSNPPPTAIPIPTNTPMPTATPIPTPTSAPAAQPPATEQPAAPPAQPPAQTSTNLFAVGDANGDGRINKNDYDMCKDAFEGGAENSKCDFNNKDGVNIIDYNIWLYSYTKKVAP